MHRLPQSLASLPMGKDDEESLDINLWKTKGTLRSGRTKVEENWLCFASQAYYLRSDLWMSDVAAPAAGDDLLDAIE